MTVNFSREEEAHLKEALESGTEIQCPRCGVPLDLTPVRPRTDVAYVRDRILVQCGQCGARAVLDRT